LSSSFVMTAPSIFQTNKEVSQMILILFIVPLQEVKHRILFLVEMLEPFLDPAIAVSKSKIAFGDLSSSFPEKQEHNCMIALNIIRAAVHKPAVLPSLESEWRHGSVAPR
jgi:hypothetical protein